MRLFRPDEAQPKDDPLLVAAVEAGDVPRVRDLLAAGSFPDSCHPTGHTNLMIAACNGQREIFEMLLDAGADPYLQYAGMAGTALDFAASVGCTEIAAVWLERGLDVNLADGVGNTPLMAAAASGRIEIVRRLLAAGADMNARTVDGITAYSLARHGRHHDVATVLREAGASFDPNDPLQAEMVSFEAQADNSSFQEVLLNVSQAVGRPTKRWQQHEEVYEFEGVVLAPAELQALQAQALRRNFYLIYATPDLATGPTTLLLFPTEDKYAVIKACGTDGGNCDLSTQKIVAWLRKLDKKHPFVLTGCGNDFLAGRFLSPVKDSNRLAVRMFKFCPDIVEQGCGSVDALALGLERTQQFVFWWD